MGFTTMAANATMRVKGEIYSARASNVLAETSRKLRGEREGAREEREGGEVERERQRTRQETHGEHGPV